MPTFQPQINVATPILSNSQKAWQSLADIWTHAYTRSYPPSTHTGRGRDLYVASAASSYWFCSTFVTDDSFHLLTAKGQRSQL